MMQHKMKRGILTVLLMLTLIVTTACGTEEPAEVAPDPSAETETNQDQQASEERVVDMDKGIYQFEATDLDGNPVTQDIFSKADLTMINVWGTFCAPCLEEMPGLGEISRTYGTIDGKTFQIIGIVIDTLDHETNIDPAQVALAEEIVAKTDADYLHILPSTDLILAKLQYVTAIPDTMFVDKFGNYVGEEYLGSKSKEEWISIIQKNMKTIQ